MMLAGFIFLLLLTDQVSLVLTDGDSSERNCSYQDVLNHLNFTKNKELYTVSRNVKNHKSPTVVHLLLRLYAILDVKEKDQQFVPYIWIDMWWKSEHIAWDPEEFCGLFNFSLPAEMFWKPDLTIEEMTERDRAPPSPFLLVHHDGDIELINDQVLVSTCRMDVYKFPFDTQMCTITFKSIVHSEDQIQLVEDLNSSKITEWSQELMRTQDEWLFINMTVTNKTIEHFSVRQSSLVYTIMIKRRSVLYIVNFMLPILLLMCLDMASFLIADNGGEKLGFKVTVLLAVTVMQLILNEILPSTSDRIPLIVVYCVGIFSLMLLSLLETILVKYLMDKDSAFQDNEADDQSLNRDYNKQDKVSFYNCFRDINKWTHCASAREMSSELRPVVKQTSSSQLTEDSNDFEKLSDDLMEAVKTLTVVLNSRKEEGKPGYWFRMTKTINRVFVTFYFIAASLFLLYMLFKWYYAEG